MYFEAGREPGPSGQHHPLSAPYGRFEARDGFLNLAAGSDAMWAKVTETLGQPGWLQDERFRSAAERIRHRDALTREIEQVLAEADVSDWVLRFNDAGVPCGPVLSIAQVFEDPQVLARDMLVELPHPEIGTFKTTGLPVKLSDTPGRIERRPPLHGEHTEEVLREHGLEEEQIAALREDGVV